MSKGKPIYAALPARTIGDERLSALDLRVLMVIAVHDRLGANGVGCYASHPRLATLVRCHLKSLSRSLRMLGLCGYIEAKQHPLNKRLRVYQVIYHSEDSEYLKTATISIGNEPATDAPSIGNHDFRNIEHDQGLAEANILGETSNTSCEASLIHPEESAPLSQGIDPERRRQLAELARQTAKAMRA